jgi:hypothetical protein
MRRTAASLICVLVTAATAAAADARWERSSAATWSGTVGFVHPFSPIVAARRANARLVVSATAIDASFEGYTGADHDSLSARTSCSIHYRFVKRQGPWSYYHQIGDARYAAGQYVQDAPCESVNYGAVRTTLGDGKLKAEFASWNPDERLMEAPEWRAYLRRG